MARPASDSCCLNTGTLDSGSCASAAVTLAFLEALGERVLVVMLKGIVNPSLLEKDNMQYQEGSEKESTKGRHFAS